MAPVLFRGFPFTRGMKYWGLLIVSYLDIGSNEMTALRVPSVSNSTALLEAAVGGMPLVHLGLQNVDIGTASLSFLTKFTDLT